MFGTFFSFELNFWLRGMMVYVFLLIIGLMIFGAVSSDHVVVGNALENTHRNAPFVIQNFYAAMAILTSLMITAFVNAAASRDFMYDTTGLVFTKPLSKWGHLLGRFWGSTLVAVIPMLGVSLGAIVGGWMPWNDAERWGPISWGAHLWSILVFALPNTIFVAAIVFAIAIWTRSTITSFIGIVLLIVGYSIASAMLGDLENETVAQLIDPFGANTFGLMTKYWTVADRNERYLGFTGMLLWNRLLWLAIGLAILGTAIATFSFAERSRAGKRALKLPESPAPARTTSVAHPSRHDAWGQWSRLVSQIRMDVLGIFKSHVFIVVMLAAFVNTFAALILNAQEGFGISALPVTYNLIEIIRGSMYAFLVSVITYYSGVVVWRERDARIDEVFDAMPHAGWIPFVAKFVALVLVIGGMLGLSVLAGVLIQATSGYHRFQWSLYFTELFLLDLTRFACLMILAMLAHVLAPNKYLGYFLFIGLVIANGFGWRLLRVDSLLLRYGQLPAYTYSDVYRYAPSAGALRWFAAYWLLFAGLLGTAGILLWQRGRETSWRQRLAAIKPRFTGGLRVAGLAMLAAWVLVAGWVYYNTRVLNEMRTPRQAEQRLARYETELRRYEDVPQPRITQVKFEIDLIPESRTLSFRGRQTLVNRGTEPIQELHLSLADGFDTSVTTERATLRDDFGDLNYQIYDLKPPLGAGEQIEMTFVVKTETKGFESSLSHPEIVQNGSFFNSQIAPQIGYQTEVELRNKNARKRLKLGEPRRMLPLDPTNLAGRGSNYVGRSADWVDVETIFSTSPDQLAIAPGSLVRSWEEGGRRYFHYKLDHSSLLFYSFLSGRYDVRREKWQGIDIEVYYHPEHEWNVPNMLRSIRKSLEYYTSEFGPYRHRQARIIEFPRIAEFAQAFAGTMPYSEGIGFIADLKDPEDIDMVFYVVAHEMAHQWWAHQIIGANMEGATTLSETLAQYSALMVMEHEYGRDMMRKFLRYEMDNYLSSRGRELLREQPLVKVEAQQGYIHYRKGSVVMYFLKELIGEDKVNAALKSLIKKFAYQRPPYPTSLDLLDALRAQTPSEYQPILTDLFEEISLYANRTVDATYRKLADDRYEVTIRAECQKFKADDQGAESNVEVDDWIEVGAFAKPEPGKKYGRTLHRERHRLRGREHVLKFTVTEPPDQVGIDPFLLLIDRMPQDNTKRARPE